jgi:transposase
MASTDGGRHPASRRYTPEQKAQAVRLVRQLRDELGTSHGTVHRVARRLGYGTESVRAWVAQADIDDRPRRRHGDEERRADQGARAGEPGAEARERDPSACVEFLRGGARPPTSLIVSFVDENKDELGVGPICSALQVAPSTYYAAKNEAGRCSRHAKTRRRAGPGPRRAELSSARRSGPSPTAGSGDRAAIDEQVGQRPRGSPMRSTASNRDRTSSRFE